MLANSKTSFTAPTTSEIEIVECGFLKYRGFSIATVPPSTKLGNTPKPLAISGNLSTEVFPLASNFRHLTILPLLSIVVA
tara:strand:+ start:31 stop:270 length:240 start_codon:yes stop_codon:yes gene_type:complete